MIRSRDTWNSSQGKVVWPLSDFIMEREDRKLRDAAEENVRVFYLPRKDHTQVSLISEEKVERSREMTYMNSNLPAIRRKSIREKPGEPVYPYHNPDVGSSDQEKTKGGRQCWYTRHCWI